jgi:hypothetical protein
MFTTTGITLKPVTLQAREEHRRPIGQPPIANRDIGFADIFLQLENHQAVQTTVVIAKIKIQAVATGRVYMATTTPATLNLGPLEYSAQDFHLTNKTGVAGTGAVQAIVTLTRDATPRHCDRPSCQSNVCSRVVVVPVVGHLLLVESGWPVVRHSLLVESGWPCGNITSCMGWRSSNCECCPISLIR